MSLNTGDFSEFLAGEVDEDRSPAMVLRGRIVTMDDRARVIESGRLVLGNGFIRAVLEPHESLPDGFENSPEFDTGATLFPGLIDLHNHFAYNALPPWPVPKRYNNRNEWPRHATYASKISLPIRALAGRPHTSAAIVRYVEAKALVGGTTTGQGIKTQVKGGTKLFKGSLRNVEQTSDPRLPEANTLVPDLFMDAKSIESFRRKLERASAYFYHLSEGIDEKARQRFLDLADHDLLSPQLVGIHALGLNSDDLKRFAAKGSKLVWSPLSNLLLYGKTMDLRALADSGVSFCIGCDWAPSGSRNLLQELKVADWENQRQGGVLTGEQLVRAVTRDAARITAWQQMLGSLESGKFADVLALEGQSGDPYRQLIEARERDVLFVLVHGIARYGRSIWMKDLPHLQDAVFEPVILAGQEMAFNFQTTGSSLNRFDFAKAKSLLEKSLADLPAFVAEDGSGDSDFLSAGEGEGEGEDGFTIELDMDHFDARPERDEGLDGFLGTGEEEFLAPDFSKIAESLPLDAMEVGPESYFEQMAQQVNVPPGLVDMLRGYYLS